MHTHLEYGLAQVRVAEMRREVERDRLESRLAKARRANHVSSEDLYEEIGPLRKGMAARAAAVVMLLFGKGAKAPTS